MISQGICFPPTKHSHLLVEHLLVLHYFSNASEWHCNGFVLLYAFGHGSQFASIIDGKLKRWFVYWLRTSSCTRPWFWIRSHFIGSSWLCNTCALLSWIGFDPPPPARRARAATCPFPARYMYISIWTYIYIYMYTYMCYAYIYTYTYVYIRRLYSGLWQAPTNKPNTWRKLCHTVLSP